MRDFYRLLSCVKQGSSFRDSERLCEPETTLD